MPVKELYDISVVVAGGSPLVASSVRTALGQARAVVATDSPAEVLELVRTTSPDVVVASTHVGVTALSEVLPEVLRCSVPVLVVCERQAVGDVPELLLGGASGFLLLEETSVEQLCDAVATTADGGSALHPAVAMTVLRQWRELRAGQTRPDLTTKEAEVLRALAEGASVRSIARSMGLSARTVETHCSRIYTKLGARGRVQAVARGIDLGLIDADRGPSASSRST